MLSVARLYSLGQRLQPLARGPVIGAIQRAFLITALVSIAWLAWASRDALAVMVRSADWRLLCLALVALTVHHIFAPAVVAIALRRCERPLSLLAALCIYGRRLPARYVPGGVWHVVSTTLDYHRYGVPPRYLVAVNLLQMALVNGFSFLLGGLGLAFLRPGTMWEPLGLVGAVAGLALMIAVGLYIPRLVRVRLSALYLVDLFWIAAAMLAMLLVFAFALVIYLAAFPGMIRGVGLLELLSVLMFARGVGFVAFFAPKGVGVFELVSAGLLGAGGTFGPLVAVLAGFRLIGLLADAVLWALATFAIGAHLNPSYENE